MFDFRFLTKTLSIMEKVNICICPATDENMNKTIHNTHQGVYCWALNGTVKGKNLFDKLKVGDIFIFGNLKKGFTKIGIVKKKRIMNDNEIHLWPFSSPSNTPWKYIFEFDSLINCNITPTMTREFRGWNNKKQTWRSQTLLKQGKDNFYNYLIENNYI